MANEKGKPKFIRKNGKVIPVGVDKKKGASGKTKKKPGVKKAGSKERALDKTAKKEFKSFKGKAKTANRFAGAGLGGIVAGVAGVVLGSKKTALAGAAATIMSIVGMKASQGKSRKHLGKSMDARDSQQAMQSKRTGKYNTGF